MKTAKKIAKWIGIIGLSLVAIVSILYLIYVKPAFDKIEATNIIKYDDNLTIFEGGGGNSGILQSDSLVIVIDSKMGDGADQLHSMVKDIAGNKPVLVINTHYHIDHSSGNHLFDGHTILAGAGYTPQTWTAEARKEDMPTLWLKEQKTIRVNDDTVTIFTLNKKVHTDGDVFVYLNNRKILFTGDVVLNQQVPSVSNGDPNAYLDAFDLLEEEFEVNQLVPGHGPTGGIEILKTFREYFTDMKTAANDESKHDELVEKYENWTQVPMLMSSQNVIDSFKKK